MPGLGHRLDFDLDGWPDLLTVNGHVYPEADRAGARYAYAQPKLLYRNLGGGRFEDVSLQAGPAIAIRKAARGAAFGDLFNRGRVDVVVNNMNDAPTLLYDCAPTDRMALVVALEGTRSNRSAIGARVVVHVGSRRLIDEVRSGGSFCSQNDRASLRPGHEREADRIEVSGRPAGATSFPVSPPARWSSSGKGRASSGHARSRRRDRPRVLDTWPRPVV